VGRKRFVAGSKGMGSVGVAARHSDQRLVRSSEKGSESDVFDPITGGLRRQHIE
jgi:hypothetical protein